MAKRKSAKAVTMDHEPTTSTGWIVGAVIVVLTIIGLFYWGGSY